MKIILRLLFITGCFTMYSYQSHAQGLYFKLLNYSSFAKHGTDNGLSWGFGYEQNVGKFLTLSLDYQKDYGQPVDETAGYSYDYKDIFYTGYGFSYDQAFRWSEVSYQSKYFFDGNDEDSWYLSSGIGVRSFHHELEITYSYADPEYEYIVPEIQIGTYKEDFILFPISLKLGRRGSLDGFYGDIFLGVTYIPGASGYLPPENSFFAGKVDYTTIKTFSLSVGLNIGFGWAE